MLRDGCGKHFTAAVARIEHRGKVVFERAYGATRDDAAAREVYVDSVFDLASLTKLFVATLALQLAAQHRLELDAPLGGVLPEWRNGAHSVITLRMLLAHTSGMNSGADYRAILDENVERFALRSDLIAEPGERVVYSDLGFIALGALLERTAGTSLATLAAATFTPPLRFRPGAAHQAAIPATEEDEWRGRVQGFVHDEKAYLMGGVAGHAGLFGTASDVARLTESYLGAINGRKRRVIAGVAGARSSFRTSLRSGAAPRPRLGAENQRRELLRPFDGRFLVRSHRLRRNLRLGRPAARLARRAA